MRDLVQFLAHVGFAITSLKYDIALTFANSPFFVQFFLLRLHRGTCVQILVFLACYHCLLHNVEEYFPLSVQLDRSLAPEWLVFCLAREALLRHLAE